MAKSIGRFEILRELGRGAQSVVYLGHDPHLDREVAIKTLHFARVDDGLKSQLLAEARLVSRLRHPNIVPIFEAGEHAGTPYLVFEYVAGDTLAQRIRRGAMAPLDAAHIVQGVLDALSEAHEQGIVHRDIKPSNIIMDGKDVPRVMDFGIAMRTVDGSGKAEDDLIGTPAYLAPEYVMQRQVDARGDVYALGLVFLEMLTGRVVRQAASVADLLEQIKTRPLVLPADLEQLDERLQVIIRKALAQDLQLRYPSAALMRSELEDFLQPLALVEDGELVLGKKQATIDFLLRRMRNRTDFPALSASVVAINRLSNSDKESINQLSNAILKDYALTTKILRVVNSSFYRPAGGGSISTVSRAAMVLGFDAIRNIALTVTMFEHLPQRSNAADIKEAFLQANLAALLAREIGQRLLPREAEEIFICAMFHNLGQLLVQFYFPDEVEDMQRLMRQRHCSNDAAMLQVLGVSFEELGMTVAQQWRFPVAVVNSLRRLAPGRVRKPLTREDTLRTVAGFANELCNCITQHAADKRRHAMQLVASRYASAVPMNEEQLRVLLHKAVDELEHMASSLQVKLDRSSLMSNSRLFAAVPPVSTQQRSAAQAGIDKDLVNTLLVNEAEEVPAMPPHRGATAALGQAADKTPAALAAAAEKPPPGAVKDSALAAPADAARAVASAAVTSGAVTSGAVTSGGAASAAVASPARAAALAVPPSTQAPPDAGVALSDAAAQLAQAALAAGIQDISNALVEDYKLNDVLRIILETMYRAMGFQRVLLCLRDARSNQMLGRYGFGGEASEFAQKLQFSLAHENDVFQVAAIRGVDIIINDIDDPSIAERIPQWFREGVAAPTFVLFPLRIKEKPVAMIYCDKAQANGIAIGTKELTLLKTLRNQAVLAIKQVT